MDFSCVQFIVSYFHTVVSLPILSNSRPHKTLRVWNRGLGPFWHVAQGRFSSLFQSQLKKKKKLTQHQIQNINDEREAKNVPMSLKYNLSDKAV